MLRPRVEQQQAHCILVSNGGTLTYLLLRKPFTTQPSQSPPYKPLPACPPEEEEERAGKVPAAAAAAAAGTQPRQPGMGPKGSNRPTSPRQLLRAPPGEAGRQAGRQGARGLRRPGCLSLPPSLIHSLTAVPEAVGGAGPQAAPAGARPRRSSGAPAVAEAKEPRHEPSHDGARSPEPAARTQQQQQRWLSPGEPSPSGPCLAQPPPGSRRRHKASRAAKQRCPAAAAVPLREMQRLLGLPPEALAGCPLPLPRKTGLSFFSPGSTSSLACSPFTVTWPVLRVP